MVLPAIARPAPRRQRALLLVALLLLSAASTAYFYSRNLIVAYGDAESHLNIAKRVVDSITPGFAQLGGIWLPLPHILMVPFVAIEPLYRTGLAGAIVSGAAYILSGWFIYKTGKLLTGSVLAGVVTCAVFALNPNILYLQSTPMTELPLIACFVLSTYYFTRFVLDDRDTWALVAAAFFGFLSTLMRYDGWFLVGCEALAIAALYSLRRWSWRELEGKLILFGTLAFFGVALWLLWDYLILGDPLYFTNSPFSAKSQQNAWAARGQLPSYHNLPSAFAYYTVTSAVNSGVVIFGLALVGLALFALVRPSWRKSCITLVLLAPYIFYVITLYAGQSIIFVPQLTPTTFLSTIFNVRYGTVMIPTVALFVGYLFAQRSRALHAVVVGLVAGNLLAFPLGCSAPITVLDGVGGLSRQQTYDAQGWLKQHYDGGMVLMDDYVRAISIIHTGLPMQNMIYVGNQPYWEQALREPQTNVRWIVMQTNDAVYQNFLGDRGKEGMQYKYYVKTYTSPDLLIFRRNDSVPAH